MISGNEQARVDALKRYNILDSLPEQEYDDIVFLASYICKTPMSLIGLIDDTRQWFKSQVGMDGTETKRELTFCTHALGDDCELLVVPDSRLDDRFKDNPFVTGSPHVIFYAGIPLRDPDGFALGTLCVIDSTPRELDHAQLKALKSLGAQVTRLMEMRRQKSDIDIKNKELLHQKEQLEKFAQIAGHDLKSPLANIRMFTDLIIEDQLISFSREGKEMISYIRDSANQLIALIDGILKYSHDTSLITKDQETLNFIELMNTVTEMADVNKTSRVTVYTHGGNSIFSHKIALQQILLNILSNSIKYNDKKQTEVQVNFYEDETDYRIELADNGPGVDPAELDRILQLYETTDNVDKYGNKGTGIGLATVKSLIDILGGRIELFSEKGKGLKTVIRIKRQG